MPSLLPEEIRLFFFGGCEMKPIIVPASIPMKLAGGARGRASPYWGQSKILDEMIRWYVRLSNLWYGHF